MEHINDLPRGEEDLMIQEHANVDAKDPPITKQNIFQKTHCNKAGSSSKAHKITKGKVPKGIQLNNSPIMKSYFYHNIILTSCPFQANSLMVHWNVQMLKRSIGELKTHNQGDT